MDFRRRGLGWERARELRLDRAEEMVHIRQMAMLGESAACLRIVGDDLVPEEITRLLGGTPTHFHVKGEQRVSKAAARPRPYKSGMWRLNAKDCIPENVDGQIEEILGQLTDDLTVWKTLAEDYEIDLFCGWFMTGSNEGLSISPKWLLALGSRGIELSLNLYAGSGEDGSGASGEIA